MTIADLYQRWEDRPFIGSFGIRLDGSIRRVYGIKPSSDLFSIIVGGIRHPITVRPVRLVYPIRGKKEKTTWIEN